jgi:hypothetical protein
MKENDTASDLFPVLQGFKSSPRPRGWTSSENRAMSAGSSTGLPLHTQQSKKTSQDDDDSDEPR